MTIEAFPLAWPPGWKRTQVRTRAKFFGKAGRWTTIKGQNHFDPRKELTISQATARVMDELKHFGVADWDVIISSNLQLREDGLPRSRQANPSDPGVAVYWKRSGEKHRCMAIDRYDRVADNLAAIAATLNAMRAIERHGGATILDRAFSGFAALPAPEQPFQILGIGANASIEEVERAYRLLASKHHPDKGGDPAKMARINWARDAMLEQRP